ICCDILLGPRLERAVASEHLLQRYGVAAVPQYLPRRVVADYHDLFALELWCRLGEEGVESERHILVTLAARERHPDVPLLIVHDFFHRRVMEFSVVEGRESVVVDDRDPTRSEADVGRFFGTIQGGRKHGRHRAVARPVEPDVGGQGPAKRRHTLLRPTGTQPQFVVEAREMVDDVDVHHMSLLVAERRPRGAVGWNRLGPRIPVARPIPGGYVTVRNPMHVVAVS